MGHQCYGKTALGILNTNRSMRSRSSGIIRIEWSERENGQGKVGWCSSSKRYSWSNLRTRTCGLRRWNSLILLGGVNRNSRSLILRNKAGLGGHIRGNSRIGSSSSEVCFGNVTIPDIRVSAHVLPDDQDVEGNIVEEHWERKKRWSDIRGRHSFQKLTRNPVQKTEGGHCLALTTHGLTPSGYVRQVVNTDKSNHFYMGHSLRKAPQSPNQRTFAAVPPRASQRIQRKADRVFVKLSGKVLMERNTDMSTQLQGQSRKWKHPCESKRGRA